MIDTLEAPAEPIIADRDVVAGVWPYRGVSLLELLRFHADKYVRLVADMHRLASVLGLVESEARFGHVEHPVTENERLDIKLLLLKVWRHASEMGLKVTARHAHELAGSDVTSHDLENLHNNMRRELEDSYFAAIPPGRIAQFKSPLAGWEDIAQLFPASTDDIEEMNRCFALCRYHAAVFHSLLVVEHGLVALGKRIGATDHKEGWDATSRQVERVIGAGYQANTTGVEFFVLEQLHARIQAMKQAWRNKVNHATGRVLLAHGGFSAETAEEIIMASRSFMRFLVEHGLS